MSKSPKAKEPTLYRMKGSLQKCLGKCVSGANWKYRPLRIVEVLREYGQYSPGSLVKGRSGYTSAVVVVTPDNEVRLERGFVYSKELLDSPGNEWRGNYLRVADASHGLRQVLNCVRPLHRDCPESFTLELGELDSNELGLWFNQELGGIKEDLKNRGINRLNVDLSGITLGEDCFGVYPLWAGIFYDSICIRVPKNNVFKNLFVERKKKIKLN